MFIATDSVKVIVAAPRNSNTYAMNRSVVANVPVTWAAAVADESIATGCRTSAVSSLVTTGNSISSSGIP
jgi:hypothetical protein